LEGAKDIYINQLAFICSGISSAYMRTPAMSYPTNQIDHRTGLQPSAFHESTSLKVELVFLVAGSQALMVQ
jgi:hypothetical protein